MNKFNQLIIGVFTLLISHAVSALDIDATTGWANRVEISSEISGKVTEVNVSAGQQVKKGTLMLQLDQRLFKAQYSNTRAQVVSDKEAKAEARRELERSLELYEQTVLAEHELQMAKNADKKAQADYKMALAKNTRAKINLERSSIIAPFDTVVIKVLRNKGESINAMTSSPLMMVIAEAGKMSATGMVAGDALSEVKTGQKAEVSVAGKSYTGKVISIGLEPEQGSKLYQVVVEFESSDLIRAGSKASISL